MCAVPRVSDICASRSVSWPQKTITLCARRFVSRHAFFVGITGDPVRLLTPGRSLLPVVRLVGLPFCLAAVEFRQPLCFFLFCHRTGQASG